MLIDYNLFPAFVNNNLDKKFDTLDKIRYFEAELLGNKRISEHGKSSGVSAGGTNSSMRQLRFHDVQVAEKYSLSVLQV